MQQFCDWVAATWLSALLSGTEWFVPAVQTIHILAISVVVTLVAMLDFRLLGITHRGPSLQQLAAGYVPWIWTALIVLFVSGVLLTVTEPSRELMNNVFRLKMLLVAALIALTLLLRSTVFRDQRYWNVTAGGRVLRRVLGLLSLALCVGIVAAGRMIAYTSS